MYTHRLTVLLLLICLTLGHAQWAQTFGWGGAGNGKRSAWSTSSNSEKYDCSQNNENILNVISSLVQLEVQRLNYCENKRRILTQ
uniref:ProtoAKH preprohormone n=1 Tax=Magallana gigas TaxID=29159 RepID=A0A455GC48_MAGGI|nr:protoAKH preprohormone [Crassostrea gigas]